MTPILHLTHNNIRVLAANLAKELMQGRTATLLIHIYPVPRGGVPVAYMLLAHGPFVVVDHPNQADYIVDDLIDSGRTRDRFHASHPHIPFKALIDKQRNGAYTGQWIVFPWEKNETGSFEDNVVRLLQYVGEDNDRVGLKETPARVAKAWKHWCSGYNKRPEDILKVFEDGAEGCDEMVVRKDIPIYSHCEHHLAAIIGKCTIAYIPNGKVLGLSKLDRLADMFARRLQVQERLTNQIADALVEYLQPIGVGVWISARHLCVESRGVQHVNSETITTALRGAIRENDASRAEFLALARS